MMTRIAAVEAFIRTAYVTVPSAPTDLCCASLVGGTPTLGLNLW